MSSAATLAPLAPGLLADIAIGLAQTTDRAGFELRGEGTRRYARLLHTAAYDAWLIEWDPAADLDLHDHGGSGGAFHVIEGILVEEFTDVERPEPLRRIVLGAGDSRPISPGRAHRVWNPGPSQTLSVHVYSSPLTSMTFYDQSGGQLQPLRTESLDNSVPGAEARL